LFGRDSEFDTDRVSIVRVAASDVRRRLLEFYRRNPPTGARISLRSGTYIPLIEMHVGESRAGVQAPPVVPPAEATNPQASRWRMIAVAALLVAVAIAAWATTRSRPVVATALTNVPLWSSVFGSGKRVSIVLADANLVMRKIRVPRDVPITTYTTSTFEYLPEFRGTFGGYLNTIPLTTVSDAMLAARIASLASRMGSDLQVQAAKTLRLSDAKGDQPLILLGSPMSDPWVELLYDQLNFKIVHRFDTGVDVVVNSTPQAGEQREYIPGSDPSGVLVGYSLVALVSNISGKAPVLLIAGTSTESTEAAGEFVTDIGRLEAALKKARGGVRGAPPKHVEFLIRASYTWAASAKAAVISSRVR
jgi:hypothetical protein